MKFRRADDGSKLETPMAAMIDVVFQLLIFFMLTLKITPVEGDFSISMPLGGVGVADDAAPPPQSLRVRLEANPDGTLKQLYFGDRGLGNLVPQSFQALNNEIGAWVASGGALADDLEVELDPDFNLDFRHTISAFSACKGRIVNGQQISYIDKIKFAPIRQPPEG